MSTPNKSKQEGEAEKLAGETLEGVKTGISMQTRFKTIPTEHLNRETVAGIRDMNLGRLKNGKPIGKPVIRFDTGANTRTDPHINIDPQGFPSRGNPHIPVSKETIASAQVVNSTLKYVGVGLTAAAVVVDAWRLGGAFKEDLRIRENADEIIKELEDAIETLKQALKTEESSEGRQNITETIKYLQTVLKDVKRTKKVPVKTIKTASSIAGGWGGGAAGGSAGAWGGASTGAWIGSAFGPGGTVVGGIAGAVVGAIGGGVSGSMAGSYAGKQVAEAGLELLDD